MRDGRQADRALTVKRRGLTIVVTVCLTLACLAVVSSLSAFLVVRVGLYDVAATAPHTPLVYWLLHTTMRHSVQHRAYGIDVPDGFKAGVAEGARLYLDRCQRCHGAPGIAPEPFALGMMPIPPNLVQTARDLPPNEIYWVIRNGVKMTGMPGWQFRLSDGEIWSIVAFISCLPKISPEDFRSATSGLDGNHNSPPSETWTRLCQ